MNDSSANTTAWWFGDGLSSTGDGGGISDGFGDISASDFLPKDFSESVRMSFCVLYVVIIVLGLGGNSMTLLVVAVNREMRTVTNVFIVSLAISDALIAGVNMPLHMRLFLQHHEWTLGLVTCKLSAYTQGVVIVASLLTLISLAIDRSGPYTVTVTYF